MNSAQEHSVVARGTGHSPKALVDQELKSLSLAELTRLFKLVTEHAARRQSALQGPPAPIKR